MATITPSNIGHSDGELDKNIKALHDKVVIRKHEVYHEKIDKGIFIPVSSDVNHRMNKGTVMSIGDEAKKDLEGLSVGDTVLYDHLAAFRDTHPIVIIKAENIICKVEEDK
jgi:co-chaperonin GroES (HSP10)